MTKRDTKVAAENLITAYIHEKLGCDHESGEAGADDLLGRLKSIGIVPSEEGGLVWEVPSEAVLVIADFFHGAMLCGHALGVNDGESLDADLAHGREVVDWLHAAGIVFRAVR